MTRTAAAIPSRSAAWPVSQPGTQPRSGGVKLAPLAPLAPFAVGC